MNTISRAQFLRGDWREKTVVLRPPWALAEDVFNQICDGCADCVEICPQHILYLHRGLAEVDFAQGECTFCGECSAVCKPGAIQRTSRTTGENRTPPWSARAVLMAHCLACNGTFCMRCTEVCEEDAIAARPAAGGHIDIHIDATACSGCGACIAGCPVGAIEMRHQE